MKPKSTASKGKFDLSGAALALLLFACGAALIAAIVTYVPTDPSFLNSGNGEVQNLMALPGAMFAGTLLPTIGLATWCFPLALIVYGIRISANQGRQRISRRAIIFPIFVILSSVFFSANVPGAGWGEDNSLGGVAGDAILSAFLDRAPVELDNWAKMLSLGFGVAAIISGLHALGFTLRELINIAHRGLWVSYLALRFALRFIKSLTKRGASTAKTSIQTVKVSRKRKAEIRDGMPAIQSDSHMSEDAKTPKAAGRSILFTVPPIFQGIRNMMTPEEEETPDPRFKSPKRVHGNEGLTGFEEARTLPTSRVSARIQEAIRRKEIKEREMQAAQAPAVKKFNRPTDGQSPVPQLEDPDAFFDTAPKPQGYADRNAPSPHADFTAPQRSEPSLTAKPFNRLTPPKSVVEHPLTKPIAQSTQAKAEAQPSLFTPAPSNDFEAPALSLLASPTTIKRHHLSDEALEENARMLENVLDDYGVKGEITSVRPGPVVTMYELEPAPGLKASRVIGLADDIARSMSALSARVSTVPGRSVIGIELPNENRETVLMREILSSRAYGDGAQGLPLALGKDIGGRPVVSDLAKMPHLLIAGTTGSGKSVAINTMIMSLLYKLSPEECRLIMIDPKMLELSVYDGIPHLLSPVVTDPKKAVVALKWVVGEMEERYRKMSKMGVRNAAGYNSKVADALAKGENFERTVQTGFAEDTGEPIFETESITPERMPYIVVIVDEMADLMMVAGKEIEACIQRLAQMARASGIHLIMATQRPSVDVITGTIKANFPTRISFQVTSKIDSRTILGEMGAEQLLGMGDMLYMEGGGKITRVHSPFISDEEVETIVNHLKIYGPPDYVTDVQKGPSEDQSNDIDQILGLGGNTDKENALYDQAVAIVAKDRKCSTSYIQRKLSIGYNKAAKIVEEMEENGIVSAANHVGKREILLPDPN